jgi:hypothetical protein
MSERCLTVEELAVALQQSETSPGRRHLAGCPRCQSVLMSYREFLEPTATLPEGELREANARLQEQLEKQLALAGQPAGPAGRSTAARRPRTHRAWRDRLPGWRTLRPAWTVALGALAVVAVIAAIELAPDRSRPIVLREQGEQRGVPTGLPALLPVEPAPDGGLTIRWQPVSGADSYEVRVYSTQLQEVARLGPVSGTSFLLRRAALPAAAAPAGAPAGTSAGTSAAAAQDTFLVRVAAQRGGAQIGLSHVTSVRLTR